MSNLTICAINRHPDDQDLMKGATRSCHPGYIKETIFRFGLSCEYPQTESLAIGMAHAQGEGYVDGVKVLFYVDWNKNMTEWGMWTRHDNDADHEWFGRVLNTLTVVNRNWSQGKKTYMFPKYHK